MQRRVVRRFAAVLVLMCALARGPGVAEACPAEVCACKWKGGKQTVECGANQLAAIPDGMDPGTQVLNFSDNSLQVLGSERFYKMELIHLQKIYMCRNQISRIFDRAFRGLSNLVELDLADNLLTTVPTETFVDYSALMRLTLSGNPIRELRANAFRQLSYLSTLEMSNCQIERIEDGAFVGMEHLEWLRLDGNRIGTIRGQNVLPKSLHGINMHGNRWACDCRMTDMHAWLNTYNVPQQQEEPKCVYPARLKGETIRYLQTEELACMPVITPSTFFLELEEGRNVSLHCDVLAIPEASVSWLFQGQLLTNDTFNYIEDVGDAQSERKHSELFLYNTRIEHNGTFTCMAENYAGRTQANYSIRMLLREVPVPEEVLVPYEYMLMGVVAIGTTGFIFTLICCCVLMRCVSRSKRRRRESAKDSTVQLQNSKCSSIISDVTGQAQAPVPILKSTNNGSSTAMLMAGATQMHQQQQQQDMLYGSAVQNSQLYSHGYQPVQQQQQQQQQHMQHAHQHEADALMAGAHHHQQQYCSPPASMRNYHHEQNPDLINDAESNNKSRQPPPMMHDTGAADVAGGEPPVSYHPVAMASSSSATLAQTTPTATSASVPRFNPMATLPRGIPKDMYHHQVDVHLNPGYYLGTAAAATDAYPVEYRQMLAAGANAQMQPTYGVQSPQHPTQAMLITPSPVGQQVNYYRTLPHRPKHGGMLAAVPRFSMEAEFVQRSQPSSAAAALLQQHHHQSQSFDAYAMRDLRYTAQGYPVGKQVAFMDQQHQRYASPPQTLVGSYGAGSPDPTTQPLQINTAGAPQPMFMHHQWPACLPGYHNQAGGLAGPAKPPLVHQQAMQSPTSSTSSSTTQTSQGNGSGTAAGSSGGGVSKRCVSAQTLDPKDTIHELNEDNDDDDDDDHDHDHDGEDDDEELDADSDALYGSTKPTANGEPRKAISSGILKHLNVPLADSPDEGYVGDSQDGSDM